MFQVLNLEELGGRYGSVEEAGARYRDLRDQGAFWWHPPLTREEVWWATEPGVPTDLRFSTWPTDREPCWIGLLPREDQDRIRAHGKSRYEWLRASGQASAEEIEDYDTDPYRYLRAELRGAAE